MAQGAQCSENGPFFPPSSGYIIQNGIAVASDILQTPDWEIIFILLGVAFLSMVIMLLALVSGVGHPTDPRLGDNFHLTGCGFPVHGHHATGFGEA